MMMIKIYIMIIILISFSIFSKLKIEIDKYQSSQMKMISEISK